MMKILIDDGMQIKIGTGIGKYSQYLYDELKKALSNNDEVDLLSFSPRNNSRKELNRLNYLLYLNSKKFRNKCHSVDIVHFTNYALPLLRKKSVKYAVTIHDLTSFIHPETLPFIYRLYNRISIKYAIKHSDIIFTVSKSIKKEIEQRFTKYTEKVYVAYPGLYDEYEAVNYEEKKYRAIN